MWRLVAALLFVAVWLLTARAVAQPRGRHLVRDYTAEDGLTNPTAYDIYQDQTGLIWVATADGVFRYDGDRFQRFGKDEGLPAAFALGVVQDGQGAIWVATAGGLARWDGQRFEALGASHGVVQLESDPDGYVWAAFDEELQRFTPQSQFEPVTGWTFGSCTALAKSQRRKGMWAAAQAGRTPGDDDEPSGRARVFLFQNGQWSSFDFVGAAPPTTIEGLIEDHAGRVWARGPNSLWVLAVGKQHFELSLDAIAAHSSTQVSGALSLDEQGFLMVATGQGLYRFDGSGERGFRVLDARSGLVGSAVRRAVVDREGSLWVAGAGVQRLLGRTLWENYTVDTGLPAAPVWALLRDSKRRFWIGTEHGLSLGSADGWLPVKETAGYAIATLQETAAGTLLLGGTPGHVLSWDPEQQALRRLGEVPRSAVNAVTRLAVDAEQNVWVGTGRTGLLRGVLGKGELELSAVPLPRGSADEIILDVSRGQAGRVWVSGQHGLALFEQGSWRRFTQSDGLVSDEVSTAREMPSGDVLVAYMGPGLSRCRLDNGIFKVVENLSGPSGEALPIVYSLGEDARGWLWLGTGRGMLVRADDAWEHFTSRDGVGSEDVSSMAFLQDTDRSLWFGTAGGLARFDGARYRGPPTAPEAWLTSAALGQQPLALGATSRAAFKANTFFAQFSSSAFAGEGKLHYAVELQGVDSGWQPLRVREARYANLGPGDYTFGVRARIGSGPWGPPASVAFRVLPAFYQTYWFRALTVLLAGLGLALLVRLRLQALSKRNQALEETVAARTGELRAANANMRLVLDNVDQGLAMLDKDGRLLQERSAAFESWFGAVEPGEHFATRIGGGEPDCEANLRFSYEQLTADILPVELALAQMPQLVARAERYFGLGFKPVSGGSASEATLLMVSDITARVTARRAEAVQREQLSAFERITRDKFGFLEFVREAESLLAKLVGRHFEDAREQLRLVHTLKGNTALFDVHSVSELAHELEHKMADGDPGAIEAALLDLSDAWQAYTARVLPLLGDETTAHLQVTREDLDELLEFARELESSKLGNFVLALVGEAISTRLGRVAEQLVHLTARLGKSGCDVSIQADKLRLKPRFYADFWASFAHVVRNAVDHGFEEAHERVSQGKPERNQVTLFGGVRDGRLVVEVSDDGRGVDWAKVAARAELLGLPHANEEQLVQAIFADGLSTADAVSQTSGRGVGMSAVWQACQALGGSVSVHSQAGQGTRFSFNLPIHAPAREDFLAGAGVSGFPKESRSTLTRSSRHPSVRVVSGAEREATKSVPR